MSRSYGNLSHIINYNKNRHRAAREQLRENELEKARKDIEVALSLLRVGDSQEAKITLEQVVADLNHNMPEAI